MKIYNLENVYTQLDDHIKLVASYTEKKYVDPIIRMCRLKPLEIVNNNKWRSELKNLKLYRKWIDEFGLQITVTKKKSILISKNTDKNKIICTDLYGCLPLDKSIKMAKILYLLIGKDSKYRNHAIIAGIGLDGYLRAWMLKKEIWQQISSLELGIKVLKIIAENTDIKYYKELKYKKPVIILCQDQRSWISFWPLHKDFLEQIKQYDFVYDVLKTKEKT